MDLLNLKKATSVRLTSIVDNSADRSFSSTVDFPNVKRYTFSKEMYHGIMPIAEHGFSMLLEVSNGVESTVMLIDAGVSEMGLKHNLEALGINISNIEDVLITHGHGDHFMGLGALSRPRENDPINVILHPDTCKQRKFAESAEGDVIYLPQLDKVMLRSMGYNVIETKDPIYRGSKLIGISGEISREVAFNNTLPYHYTLTDDEWIMDTQVLDEMFVVVNVEGKGLIIVTGCSHAGVINVIKHAQLVTGESKIMGIIGGFHLYHHEDLEYILAELKKIDPQFIVPSHCTGWKAIYAIAEMFPEAYIPLSVGASIAF